MRRVTEALLNSKKKHVLTHEQKVKRMRALALSQKEVLILTDEVAQRDLKRVPATSEHEVLRVKDGDIFLVLYTSGKLVFQESRRVGELLNKVLIRDKYTTIGTDEAGKGEWYGPLVVAGVALQPEDAIEMRKMGVSDSKELSLFRIYEIGNFLNTAGIKKKVRVFPPEMYNRLYDSFKRKKKNLNDILSEAHAQIIRDLLNQIQCDNVRVFIDKFDSSKESKLLGNLEPFNVSVIEKPGGESESAVAAASILAKYTFEEEVKALNRTFQLDLKTMDPEDVPPSVLPLVAKIHFRNVRNTLKE